VPYDEVTMDMVRQALFITLKICAPILAAGVVVGLVISIFQSVTSIQDQTLSFVPKIIVMILVAAVLTPWIIQRLIDYSRELLTLTAG
jgi:flagellar biosynthetic protein FliQ